MFLATTALTEFWDKDQEILFLGPWCHRYDRRSDWESLDFRVLPSPWDDRDRYQRVPAYLDGSYEQMLDQLAEYLNTVHRVSFENRYWRILIGPWLIQYIHVVYDRLIHLQEAFQEYPDLETIVLDQQCFKTPRDTLQFFNFVTDPPFDDIYNLQIYSQLLHSTGHSSPVRMLQNGWPKTAAASTGSVVAWRPVARALQRWGLRLGAKTIGRAVGTRYQIGLYDMSAAPTATWKLAWKTRLRAIPIELGKDWIVPTPVFDGSRSGLSALKSTDEFGRILVQLLPQNFPAVYLEGYETGRAITAMDRFRIPPVVVTSIGWYFNTRFQYFAAEASQQGKRLVAVQHGGGYGMFKYSALEPHETAVSDSYMVWGWADATGGNHRNLPSLKVSQLPSRRFRNSSTNNDESLLFVATCHPRYLPRFQSQPAAGQWEDYMAWGLRFLTAISKRTISALVLRPYHTDYGWGHKARILDKFPDLLFDDGQPFHKAIGRCSVAIIDHPSTTFLETMAANIPTVLFWDPNLWGIRDEAAPYFEDLNRVGLLWHSPEAAAAHVEIIRKDPWAWWGSTEVQEARIRFANRFALASEDWANCWAQALREEVAQSNVNI